MANPIANDARLQNITMKLWCRYCRNDGMVEVSVGMVPCPFCEAGFEKEFQKGSPWAEGGFWRHADEQLLTELTPAENQSPLPVDVAKFELEKLRATIGKDVAA